MPLQRRVPKFGFKNRFRVEYKAVNVGQLAELLEAGRLVASEPISPETLREAGLLGKSDLLKVLGGGEIGVAITLSANAFSKSAIKKIEKAGGSATVVSKVAKST